MTFDGDRQTPRGRKLQIVQGLGSADEVQALLARLDADAVLEFSCVSAKLLEPLQALGLHVEGEALLRVSRHPFRPLVELLGMEPPAPMEAILSAAATLGPEEIYLAHLPHYPAPLVPVLALRPVEFELALRPDQTALLWMRRRP